MRIAEFLARRLERGDIRLGQLLVGRDLSLSHAEDAGRTDLRLFHDPYDAEEIVKYDDAGKYRPLKTAPNLRHGWRLELETAADLRLALDFFYPAALGTIVALAEGALQAVDLRATLARQSGMYAVVRKITNEQAADLIRTTCNKETGCLRRMLWEIAPGEPGPCTEAAEPLRQALAEEGAMPLLCAEACNLLVAAGRELAKAR